MTGEVDALVWTKMMTTSNEKGDDAPLRLPGERCEGAPAAIFDEVRGRTRDEHELLTSAAWYSAWAAAYTGTAHWRPPLRTLVVRDSRSAVCGALPLATLRVARQDLAALAGLYQPYRTVLVDRADARAAGRALADTFADAETVPGLRLAGCGEPDQGVQALLGRLRERGWAVIDEPNGHAQTVALPSSVAELEARMSKRMLQNSRYYERKMRKEGQVELRLFQGVAGDEWTRVIADLGRLEEHSWMATRGGAMRFSGAANARFWKTLLADSRTSAAAHAFILYFQGQPASFVFAFDSGSTRFVLANNYDEAVQRYSTGSILYRHLFADAIDKQRALVHLGRGDTGYKAHWGAEATRAMRNYVACRPTLRGRALFAALTLRQAVGQLRRQTGEGDDD